MVAVGDRRVVRVDERDDLVAQVVLVRPVELEFRYCEPPREVHASTITTIAGGQSPRANISSRRSTNVGSNAERDGQHVDLADEPLDPVDRRAAGSPPSTPGLRYTYSGRVSGSPSGLPANSSDCTSRRSSVPASGRSQGASGNAVAFDHRHGPGRYAKSGHRRPLAAVGRGDIVAMTRMSDSAKTKSARTNGNGSQPAAARR